MSDQRNDGGSAFPILNDGCQFPRAEGMTLRDYFAAKAMQAFLANPILFERYGFDPDFSGEVKSAYAMADAMLAARNA